MAELYAKDVCQLALAQVGKSCGKTNEYSKELDSVNFYNTKKNGYADSCSIFVDDMVYRCIKPKSADNARAALYEPNKDNCGAGCTQAANYFKAHNAFYTKCQDAKCGDKIFFKKSNGQIYHTGLVVDWDSKGLYTVEGNTDGGKVAKKFYKYGDSKIAGFGRPKYTAYEKAAAPAAPSAPAAKPAATKYKVKTNGSVLNVRAKANTSAAIVTQIKNGTTITVSEIVKGSNVLGNTNWARIIYNGKIGYVSCKWIVKA